MKPMGPRKTVFVVGLVALAALPLAAQQATVVIDRGNGDIREETDIRVSKDSYSGVEGKKGAAQLSWRAKQVIAIRWNVAPDAYKKAMNLFEDGAYEKAAEMFEEALAGPGKYEWVPAYGNYHLGRSLARIGDAEGALKAFQNLEKAAPDHRFVPEAWSEMADIHLSRSEGANPKAAQEVLNKLKSVAGKLDESYAVQADLGLARVQTLTGNPQGAIQALDQLASRAQRDPRLQTLVAMERGRAHVALKQYDQAERYFKNILESKTIRDAEVIAGAANGLGDSQFEQQKYGDAMWSYSRTYALFHERDSLRQQVGWALYRGGEAFNLQAGLSQDPEERSRLQSYATRVRRRAATQFKETAGGQEARRALGLVN
jgi:tetratricopeptide (TPR) repeat protein